MVHIEYIPVGLYVQSSMVQSRTYRPQLEALGTVEYITAHFTLLHSHSFPAELLQQRGNIFLRETCLQQDQFCSSQCCELCMCWRSCARCRCWCGKGRWMRRFRCPRSVLLCMALGLVSGIPFHSWCAPSKHGQGWRPGAVIIYLHVYTSVPV